MKVCLTVLSFTMQVYFEWRKVVTRYMKRMDLSLPFYCYTGSDRFYEEEMPSFNDEPRRKETSNRLPRAEVIVADTTITRRSSLPIRCTLSIRAAFHAIPVCMSPMASATSIDRFISEHSYSRLIKNDFTLFSILLSH